jgi:hypothetical protein
VQGPPLCSEMFFLCRFRAANSNPPLPLVFMQNHPFITRHACLAAISCLSRSASRSLVVLFRHTLITRTRSPYLGSTPRNLFVNFTATTRKSTSINARLPAILGALFLLSLQDFRICSSSPSSLVSPVQVFDGKTKEGGRDEPHFSEVTRGYGQAG